MRGFILEKNPILANIVTKSSPNLTQQRDMKEPILEKNHMLADIVTKGFPNPKVQRYTRGPILEITPVMIVE